MVQNQPSKAVQILSPEALWDQQREFTIIDAREEGFAKGHIPKSLPLDWKDLTEVRPGWISYLLGRQASWGKVTCNPQVIEPLLSSLNIANASKVVVVGEPFRWGTEGRMAWNLLYWGLERVFLLDGGFPAWKKRGFEVATGRAQKPEKNPQVQFHLQCDPARRIETSELAMSFMKHPLIDARSPEEFQGQKMLGQKRGGHLPGAKNVPVASLYTPDGRFVRLKNFEPSSSQQVAYCVGGVRSGLFAVLSEAATDQKVRNYDGSIWAWAANQKLPLILG